METVDLKIDEQNELEFKLKIESSEQISPPKARLVCESKGISYMFDGEITRGGEVKVLIPSMEGRLKEGKYTTKLEILVDNKLFLPLEFQLKFKKGTKIVAEIKKPKPKSTVKASIVTQTTTLKEKAEERKKAKIRAAKKKKLVEEAKQKKIEELKKQKALKEKRAKRKKTPDEELQGLLDELGISEE